MATGRMCGDLSGNSSAKDAPERGNDGENVGELSGMSCAKDADLEGKSSGFLGADKQGK